MPTDEQFQAGVYEARAISSAPMDVVALLRSRAEITKADIAEMFWDLNVQTLSFDGHKFDAAGAQAALAECIGKSMTLTELSFKNVKSTADFDVVAVCVSGLVENLSVQRLDLSDCDLTKTHAESLGSIVPWNRTVVDWDLSGNTLLGDDGVLAFINALVAATSSIQRLSLRRTGITDVNKVAKLLEDLTCLYQVDLSENGGAPLSQATSSSLQTVLVNNLTLLHPTAKVTSVPLVAPPPPPPPAATAPSGGDNSNGGDRKDGNENNADSPADKKQQPAPARQRTSSFKQPASATHRSRSDSRASKSAPPPSGGSSPASPPPAQRQQHADPNDGAASPAPAPAAESKPSSSSNNAASKGDDGSAPKKDEQPKTQPAAKQQQHQQPQPQAKASPSRGRSPSARPAATASPSRSYTRSASHAQKDILDGVEEWKKIRNQYNQFIRAASPGAASSSSERKLPAAPKYVLGKRVDDRPVPSAVFKSGPTRTRERMPTPSEIRKLAPWNQPQAATTVGQVVRVELPERTGVTKEPIVLHFLDGGRQTYIEEDPRDLGYLARKIQTGQVKPAGSLYRSNTPRDLRFGVDYTDKTYVSRTAQAPAPGTYVVESEWEKRARLLRERARAVSGTGKPMFGTSGAPRAAADHSKKDLSRPGPGEYEIP